MIIDKLIQVLTLKVHQVHKTHTIKIIMTTIIETNRDRHILRIEATMIISIVKRMVHFIEAIIRNEIWNLKFKSTENIIYN